MLRFTDYHSRRLHMRTPFHTKNFEILTKFSDFMAEKNVDVQNFTAIRLIIIPQWQKY